MASVRIWVFDVEHGSAAFMRAPSGETMMIDCGKAGDFSPVVYLYQYELSASEQGAYHPLRKLIVTHPHDDHIEDIDNLIKFMRPNMIKRLRYDWEEVEGESGGDYENLDTWAEFQDGYNTAADPVDWGGVEISHWGLSVSEAKQLNASKFINNSSIITIVEYGGFKVVFPGDIEKDGWLALLGNASFCTALANANIFITSHHGHSSGYAAEIYDAMGRPNFNLSSIHHGDESVESAYASSERALGTSYNGETRNHFTTRKDGAMLLEIDENGHGTFGFYRLDSNL